jgi:thymidylate synthase (FAD)
VRIELLDKEKKANELWERWGRLADKTHNDSGENREQIAKSCLKSKHWGQSEMVYFDFEIKDVSVGIFMPQLLHHTIGVASGIKSFRIPRYGITLVLPDDFPEEFRVRYIDHFWDAVVLYEDALKAGIPAEEARGCLPLAIGTELIWCADIEAIQKLCEDRLCNKADREIHEMAQLIRDEMLSIIPELDPFLGPKCWVYGKCFEQSPCGK